MNKVILMGRLTADPELRQTSTGKSVCDITIAVDRRFTPQGQERQADFIPVTLWQQTAEFVCKYFQKGKMIAVEGSMQISSYNDTRHPEVKHYVTKVIADNVYFTGDKGQSQGSDFGGGNTYNKPAPSQNQAPQYAQSPAAPAISVGDLGDFEEVIGDSELPF